MASKIDELSERRENKERLKFLGLLQRQATGLARNIKILGSTKQVSMNQIDLMYRGLAALNDQILFMQGCDTPMPEEILAGMGIIASTALLDHEVEEKLGVTTDNLRDKVGRILKIT